MLSTTTNLLKNCAKSAVAVTLKRKTASTGRLNLILKNPSRSFATTASGGAGSVVAQRPSRSLSTLSPSLSADEALGYDIDDDNLQELDLLETNPAAAIAEANQRSAGSVIIREASKEKGMGIFAARNFAANELVLKSRALLTSTTQDKYSVQTDWDRHVQMDLPARFINHICNEANVGIQLNEYGSYDFVALRPIAAQEELLWDYETTEFAVLPGFHCKCGSSNCRQELKGFQYHGGSVLAAYGEHFTAPYLLNNNKNVK